jgi:hypothetical protein
MFGELANAMGVKTVRSSLRSTLPCFPCDDVLIVTFDSNEEMLYRPASPTQLLELPPPGPNPNPSLSSLVLTCC